MKYKVGDKVLFEFEEYIRGGVKIGEIVKIEEYGWFKKKNYYRVIYTFAWDNLHILISEEEILKKLK